MNAVTPKPRLTPGRVVYLTYHRPLAWLAQSRREGGPWQQWLTRRGQRQMIEAAATLPPRAAADATAPEVVFLTGERFWFQTAFCLWSLNQHAGRPIRA